MSESAIPPPLPPKVQKVPIARLWPRFLALLMDVILIGTLVAFLLVKVLIPKEHPEGLDAFLEAYRNYEAEVQAAVEAGEKTPPPPDLAANEAILEMAAYVQMVLLMVFFLYFGACEWFMRGSSLGKRTFALRSAVVGTSLPPSPLQGILRAAMKAFALVGYPPFTWLLLIMGLFISGRRTAHDMLARTVVIEGGTSQSRTEA